MKLERLLSIEFRTFWTKKNLSNCISNHNAKVYKAFNKPMRQHAIASDNFALNTWILKRNCSSKTMTAMGLYVLYWKRILQKRCNWNKIPFVYEKPQNDITEYYELIVLAWWKLRKFFVFQLKFKWFSYSFACIERISCHILDRFCLIL